MALAGCRLPEGLRPLLARPVPGSLLVGPAELLVQHRYRVAAAVGDYVARLLWRLGSRPRLVVYDCASMRRPGACPTPPREYRVVEARNPRSMVTEELVGAVSEGLRAGMVAVRVRGEEDLAALPLLLLLDNGSMLAYGQPGLATVLVSVTPWVKRFAAAILTRMGCRGLRGIPL